MIKPLNIYFIATGSWYLRVRVHVRVRVRVRARVNMRARVRVCLFIMKTHEADTQLHVLYQ